MHVLCIDPGEHTGMLFAHDDILEGYTFTAFNNYRSLWSIIEEYKPDVIVYERFALRADKALKQTGSVFITCEVIGIIKLYASIHNIQLVELLPVYKEYCGFSSKPSDPHYQLIQIRAGQKITEHVRDTMRLYSYYKLFKLGR